MKKLIIPVCLAVFFGITGCKKESNSINNSIQGSWELRRASGMLTVDYPPGTGQIFKFSGSSYEIITNGQVTKSGTFEIVKDPSVAASTCMVIAKNQYQHKITYDNNTNEAKVFMEIANDTLHLISGCFAIDAGVVRDYIRIQ